jgi:hypothetical protein
MSSIYVIFRIPQALSKPKPNQTVFPNNIIGKRLII